MKKWMSFLCVVILCFISSCRSNQPNLKVLHKNGSFDFSERFSNVNLSTEASFSDRVQNFFSRLAGNSTTYPVPITGRFFVDGNGNSNYSVPLKLPPSVSRVGVHLSLNYNSAFLNTYVGFGWRLSGFSQVSLCSQNYFFDQAWSNTRTNNANLYGRNRFCLDGQRLVAINGVYGADGSTYHTETFNGKRIKSVGSCGNGPCYFQVFDSRGNQRTYGKSSNSHLVVRSTVGNPSEDILTWALDEIIDPDGRKVDFSYNQGAQFDNTLYPAAITYGVFSANDTKGMRKITFNYNSGPRMTQQNRYMALTTIQTQQQKLLQNIVSSIDGKTVTVYSLKHEYNSFSRRNRLTELSYCNDKAGLATKCFAQSNFEYPSMQQTPTGVTFKQSSSAVLGNFPKNGVKFVLMDKYGTGYSGLGVIFESSGSAQFKFFKNDGSGRLISTQDNMILGDWGYDTSDLSKSYDFRVFDKNGDGINDLAKIQKGSSGQTFAYSYISGFNQVNFKEETNPTLINNIFDTKGDVHYVLKDLNGDGLSDIVQLDPTQSPDGRYNITLFYSSVAGGFPTKNNITQNVTGYVMPYKNSGVDFVDLDGDSLADLHLLVNANGSENTGSFNVLGLPYYHHKGEFIGPKNYQAGVLLGNNSGWDALPVYKWFDFNNDGLKDFLLFGYQGGSVTGEIFINTGGLYKNILSNNRNQNIVTNAFTLSSGQESSEATPKQEPFRNIIIGDVDGDGYQDLLHYLSKNNTDSSGKETSTNNRFALFRNTGVTFEQLNLTQDFGDNSKNYTVDLNGDGVMDILSIQMIGNQAIARSFINKIPKKYDHLLKIHNGIGRVVSLDYGQLSEVHDIEVDEAPKFPYIIYQQPRIVVHSYSDQNGAGQNYSYQRKFNLRYKNGIFNRHNWQFSGFQRVDTHDSARDIIESRSYGTIHPFRGVVKAIEVKKATTGEMFSGSYFKHDSQDIFNSNGSPSIKLVRKLSSYRSTFYRHKGDTTDKEAFRHVEEYGYGDLSTTDGKYGNIISKSQYIQSGSKKSDSLNYCYTYMNKVSADSWALGFKTGEKASKKSSCLSFTDPKTYKWDGVNDLRLLHNTYNKDKLRAMHTRSYVYDPVTPASSGWVGSSYIYNEHGQIKILKRNAAYANTSGEYPADNKQASITFSYDDYGFVNSRQYKSSDQTEQLTKQLTVDPRFGRISSIIYPSGVHIRGKLDELGLLSQVFVNEPISNTQKQVENYSYVTDGNNIYSLKQIRTDWSDDNVDNWHYQKVYYDGNQSVHMKTFRGFDGTDRVIEEYHRDFNTGRVSHTAAPYYNQKVPLLTKHTYDDRGRLKTVTRDDGFFVSYNHSYGAGRSSRQVQTPSPSGSCGEMADQVSLSVVYNHLERNLNITWPDKSTIQRNYNLFSRQISFKDGRGLVHAWNYDSLGRVTSHTSPDVGKTMVQYDAHSRPSGYQFSGGTTMSMVHDGLGRLVSRTSAKDKESSTETYVYSEQSGKYNNIGQLTSLALSNGVKIQYNYDSNGNISQQIVQGEGLAQKQKFTFQYSPLKQKTMMTYPDNSSLHWNYAQTGELKTYEYKEGTKRQNLVTINSYNPSGSVKSIKHGNGVTVNYGFDGLGRVTQLVAGASGGDSQSASFLTHNYCYNSLGLKVQRKINKGGQNTVENFNYDLRGRVSSYVNGSQTNAYKYDSSGNLLQKNGVKLIVAKENNQIVSGTVNGSTLSTSYSEEGRLLTKVLQGEKGKSSFAYTYDSFGRLANYVFPQGNVNYKYGINGYRFSREVKKGSAIQTSYYVSPYYEVHTDGTNTSIVKNMQLSSVTLASKVGDQMRFFVRDHLGSLLATTNESGKPSLSKSFSPYGNMLGGQLEDNSEFTGHKYDSELQHYNFVHRNYDPDLGRFLTPDPIRQYASGYGYAGGQPLNRIDRNGLEFGEIIGPIVSTVIAAIMAATTATTEAAAVTAEVAGAVTAADVGLGVAGSEVATSVVSGAVITDTVASTQAIVTSAEAVSVSTTASVVTTATESVSGAVGLEGGVQVGSSLVEANTFVESTVLQSAVDASTEIESLGGSALGGSEQAVGEGLEEGGSSLAETAGEGVEQAGGDAATQTGEEGANEAAQQTARSARTVLRAVGRRFLVPAAKFLASQLVGLSIGSVPAIIQQEIEKHHQKYEANSGPEYGNDGFVGSFGETNGKKTLANTYNMSTSLGTPYGTMQKRSERSPSLGFPSINTRGQGLVSVPDPQYFNDFHPERRRAVDYSQILINSRSLGNHYPIYISY